MGEVSSAADRVRSRLRELDWSQREMAAALGTSTAVVSRILSGERMPSLRIAIRIQKSEIGVPADAWVALSDADESGEHPAVVPAGSKIAAGG